MGNLTNPNKGVKVQQLATFKGECDNTYASKSQVKDFATTTESVSAANELT